MNRLLPDWAEDIGIRVDTADTVTRLGKVVQVAGLVVESEGPQASLGNICDIVSPSSDLVIHAEVVGFRDNRILLMPLEDMEGVHPGCHVKLFASWFRGSWKSLRWLWATHGQFWSYPLQRRTISVPAYSQSLVEKADQKALRDRH